MPDTSVSDTKRKLRQLILIGSVLWVICLCIALMSREFAWHTSYADRPVRLFLGLMMGAFVLHLFGFWVSTLR